AASKAIADWVNKGGRLFATAWAGTFDEFNRPNAVLRDLLGIAPVGTIKIEGTMVGREKEDLPFEKPIDTVIRKESDKERPLPVVGLRSQVAANGTEVVAKFANAKPAVTTRTAGKGQVWYV